MKKYKQIIISLNNKREILLRYILVAIATVILLKFNELDIYYERHEKYFLFLVPIMTTIAIFVMNFNSGKVLNKPFSFYYVKYWGSIMWIIIPIVFQFILFTIGVDINFNKYILVFNSLFYSYLVFEVFKDIFKWNHSYYFRKYRNGYVEAIKMLPFTEVDDARMFFEFSEIMDNDTIQLKEEYPNICNERLNTLIQIRKTNNEIDMDDFTFKLLQLNVIENSSISIDLKHEYDFYNSFFKRSDKNFLREILLKCDFKLDNYTSEITFRIVFDHFCERIDNYTGFKLFLKNVINIREDLDSSFIKSRV